jgi:biopolymer transport protein ExbD
MVNTGDVEILQPDEQIDLPSSLADLRPDESPLIKIRGDSLLFRDQQVGSIRSIANGGNTIEPLYRALTAYAPDAVEKSTANRSSSATRSVAIMGDVSLPYATLKKILHTCAQAGYRDVSLAVEHSPRSTGDRA